MKRRALVRAGRPRPTVRALAGYLRPGRLVYTGKAVGRLDAHRTPAKRGIMNSLPGKPVSLWLDTTPTTDFPEQTGDVQVDAAVLGGGIVGVITAFLLKHAGLTVCLVERHRVAGAVSGHTTAKVTSLHGVVYRPLVTRHGKEKARLYGESNQAGLEWIATTVAELGIDCDFERAPAYTYATEESGARELKAEAETARDLGLPVGYTVETELPMQVAGAVRFDNQARFHPRKFLLGLVAGLPGDGSHVFELTAARDVEGRRPYTVITDKGRVRAESVIIATHLPFLRRGLLFARTYPRRHPVVAIRSNLPAFTGMYVAYDRSYPHSVRQQPTADGPVLIVGGESWKTGHVASTAERWRRLIAQSRERLAAASIEYRWGAQDYYSVDLLPFVGELTPRSDRLLTATGFGAWGMTNGAAAGLLLADLVLGRENSWSELYDPNRLALRAGAGKTVSENIDAARRLVLPKLRRAPGIVASVHEGEGRVLELGGRKAAVSRDERGNLHAVSPTCTHLGCQLTWNDAEKTWDCPCHGSRYTPEGEIVQGPALNKLQDIDLA